MAAAYLNFTRGRDYDIFENWDCTPSGGEGASHFETLESERYDVDTALSGMLA